METDYMEQKYEAIPDFEMVKNAMISKLTDKQVVLIVRSWATKIIYLSICCHTHQIRYVF